MIAITTFVTDDEVLVISRAFLVRLSFSVQCLVLLSWTFLPLSMIVHFNLISRLRICFSRFALPSIIVGLFCTSILQ
jgi:hypothetical protein